MAQREDYEYSPQLSQEDEADLERMDRVHQLVRAADPSSIPALLEALEDSCEEVRYAALFGLIHDLHKRDAEIEALCFQMMLSDSDSAVQQLAASSIGTINQGSRARELFHRLVGLLKSPELPEAAAQGAYWSLFVIAGTHPDLWPRSVRSGDLYVNPEIDWSKIAWLEDQLEVER